MPKTSLRQVREIGTAVRGSHPDYGDDDNTIFIVFSCGGLLTAGVDRLRLVERPKTTILEILRRGWGVYCSLAKRDVDKLRSLGLCVVAKEGQAKTPPWSKAQFEVAKDRETKVGVWGWVRGGWGIALYYLTETGQVDFDRPTGDRLSGLTQLRSGLAAVSRGALTVTKLKLTAALFDERVPKLSTSDGLKGLSKSEKETAHKIQVEANAASATGTAHQ